LEPMVYPTHIIHFRSWWHSCNCDVCLQGCTQSI